MQVFTNQTLLPFFSQFIPSGVKRNTTYLIGGCYAVTVFSAFPGYAAGAAAQATIMQPGQTAFVAAAPHAPTYETYQTSQTAAQQYAFATRSQVGFQDAFMFYFFLFI